MSWDKPTRRLADTTFAFLRNPSRQSAQDCMTRAVQVLTIRNNLLTHVTGRLRDSNTRPNMRFMKGF
jgi:hypothetical protein